MKSVIQEASSLTKAIELGWAKAGKPREFTVKIYQEAKKNFFGMTIVPAKVAIFFREIEQNTQQNNQQGQRNFHQKPRPQQQRQHSQQQNQGQQKRRYYNPNKKRQHPQERQQHQRDDSNNINYSNSSDNDNKD